MNAPSTDEEIDQGEIVRALVDKGGLHEFLKIFWGVIVPAPFVDNWHIGAMCEYLEAVSLGEIKKLVLNVPPATGKTGLVSIMWPAWQWALKPETKFLVASFDQSLVLDSADKMINILQSERYQAAYPYVQLLNKNPARGNFRNTSGGLRFSTTPEGKATGRHAHIAIVDDPMKPQDAIKLRKPAFDRVNSWFSGTLPTRAVDPKNFARVIIMQRLHTDDLAGMCLAQGYESLILPMRQVKRTMWARDPRKELGELLWPERYPEEKVRELELELRNEASAQLQQDPTPMTGGIIEETWTRLEWVDVPTKGTFVQSWDFSSKGTKESHSKVSGQLWCVTRDMKLVRELLSTLEDRLARIPGSLGDGRIKTLGDRAEMFVLIDKVGGHWNFVRSKAEFLAAQNRPHWKRARVKLLERKANGQAVIDELTSKVQGILGIDPSDDKESRLRVHSDKFEIGQVVFPPGTMGDEVREQLIKFPRHTWDDDVDTCTQALDRLASKAERYRSNLAKIAREGGGDW
jgi:predicted phage terminase large subunit-like protein